MPDEPRDVVPKCFPYNNKPFTVNGIDNVLDRLFDYLKSKNVDADLSAELIYSVGQSLIGKHLNSWIGLKSSVKNALEKRILGILSPNRNIDILDEISQESTPYFITFSGNQEAKTRAINKISEWLVMNSVSVLLVTCGQHWKEAASGLQVYRVGQAESRLSEKANRRKVVGTVQHEIQYARDNRILCCLIDLADGTDKLAKLLRAKRPNLSLFVCDAPVGKEAVQNLIKFNESTKRCGCKSVDNRSSAFNAILINELDMNDDQIGAALSMTYISGKPVMFFGDGYQHLNHLNQLDVRSVVNVLVNGPNV